MPRPPRPTARPGAASSPSAIAAPALREAGEEARRADRVEQFDRRHVERQLQGAARRHLTLEGQVEVLRRIAAEPRRTVFEKRLGMGDAALESERIDEGFERRARRADRLRHVDGTGALGGKIIGAADMGADLAGRIVDDEDRRRDFRAEPFGIVARQLLERRLQAGIDRQPQNGGVRRAAPSLLARMRRQCRERLACAGNRLGFGRFRLGRGQRAGGDRAVEHAVAGAACRLGRTVRTPCFRRLRQGDEQGRFARP